MRIVDEAILKEFRGGVCEWCKMAVAVHAHHLFSKGSGRVDCRFNICGICAKCHFNAHNANTGNPSCRPSFLDLLKLISRREKIDPELLIDRIRELQRLPKDSERPVWDDE
jgi:hypothetical protein